MICDTCKADVAQIGHDDNCAEVLEALAEDRSQREFRGAQTQTFRAKGVWKFNKAVRTRGGKIRTNKLKADGTIDKRRNWQAA